MDLRIDEKDKIAEYVQECELCKKDKDTLKRAFDNCTDQKQVNTSSVIVLIGMSLLTGVVIGSMIGGNNR